MPLSKDKDSGEGSSRVMTGTLADQVRSSTMSHEAPLDSVGYEFKPSGTRGSIGCSPSLLNKKWGDYTSEERESMSFH